MNGSGNDLSGTRRRFLSALGITAVSIGNAGAASGSDGVEVNRPSNSTRSQTAESDATMLRYDAKNTGEAASETAPREGVTEAWTFETAGPIRAQPIIADGTVYVASEDSKLYALDAETGSEKWSRQHDSALTSGPVVSDGIIYVPTSNRLVAYSAATGDGQFAVDVGSRVGTPTVAGGTLYVRTGNSLRAIDGTNGEQVWSVGLKDNEATDTLRNLAVTVTDDSVYVADGAKTGTYSDRVAIFLRALNRADGSQKWENRIRSFSYDNDQPFDTTITATNDTLYFGAVDAVRTFNPSDGAGKWTYSSLGAVRTYPTVSDGTVYVSAKDGLYAIDPTVGTSRWSTSIPGRPLSPVLAGETLIVGSSDNNIYAFNTEGEQLWSFQTGNNIVAPPIVVNGTVYAGSTDGVVYALSPSDGPEGPDVTGDGNPATDPDGDGIFEDVNGDGEFTILDVQALFANLDSEAVQSNPSLFDVNGDGEVDVTDVQALFAELEGNDS